MPDVKILFDRFIAEAKQIRDQHPGDLDAELVALENRIADNSGLGEGKRLELRAYMQEYRRKMVDGFEAGATTSHLSNKDSGPRSGEYDASDT